MEKESITQLPLDLFASFGAQTAGHFSDIFNNLPLPILTGKEIQQYWEDKMSAKGKDHYENDWFYQQLTAPEFVTNFIPGVGAAGKFSKAMGAAIDPIGEGAFLLMKNYGKVINNNAKLRNAASIY